MKAKTIGISVIILVLGVGSILAYNWKTIAPTPVQTTTSTGATTSTGKTSSASMRIKTPINGCYLGSYIDGAPPINSQQIRAFEQMIGKRLAIMCLNYVAQDASSGQTTFPRKDLESILETGSIPMIGCYPILKDARGATTAPRLQDVIDGKLDVLIRDWALGIRQLSSPVFVRLGWEMNLEVSFWSGAHNFGSQSDRKWNDVDNLFTHYGDAKKPDGPERYVEAWKHIRRVFGETGSSNAIWVWCPHHRSDPDAEWNKPENYYPGDDYVDWIGFDLYNGGYIKTDSKGRSVLWSFDEIFTRYYGLELYKGHQNKPLILAELGCLQEVPAEVIGDKAKWILNAYDSIKNEYPNIKAVCWFSKDKRSAGEKNWRVDSSSESLEAYRKAVSDPYFLDRIMFEAGGQVSPSAVFHCAVVVSAAASSQAFTTHNHHGRSSCD